MRDDIKAIAEKKEQHSHTHTAKMCINKVQKEKASENCCTSRTERAVARWLSFFISRKRYQ